VDAVSAFSRETDFGNEFSASLYPCFGNKGCGHPGSYSRSQGILCRKPCMPRIPRLLNDPITWFGAGVPATFYNLKALCLLSWLLSNSQLSLRSCTHSDVYCASHFNGSSFSRRAGVAKCGCRAVPGKEPHSYLLRSGCVPIRRSG
jgi:hypothetical protein